MNCVYRASSVEEADIVVAWLGNRDVAAFVKNRNMAGTYVTLAVAPRGVEVCVLDPGMAEEAKLLLLEHREEVQSRPRGDFEKVVPVQCPECGRMLEFPGEFFGTVQTCPDCGQSVDVGDSPNFC